MTGISDGHDEGNPHLDKIPLPGGCKILGLKTNVRKNIDTTE
ncbi:MAG: hypothetical protein PHH79_08045 [Aminobacterium colombiense]|nr:hypothetical protein [Aminobacterium colombiense]